MTGSALTIGQLAARLGVPVRTVRSWSDEGLVDPPARSAGGYRLHDAGAVARLDLVRTLREPGLRAAGRLPRRRPSRCRSGGRTTSGT